MIKLIVALVIHGDGSNRYKHAKIFNQNYVLIQVPHIKKMITFNASNHIEINQIVQKSLQEKGQDKVSVSKVLLTARQHPTVQVHHPSTWIVTSNSFRSRRSWTRGKCAGNVLFVVYFKSFIIGLVNNKLERKISSLNVV